MAQTNQIKNIVMSLSYEDRCLLERIIFEDISNPSSTTKTHSECRFRSLNTDDIFNRSGTTLPNLSPDIELSLINFFKSSNDPWFEDENENYSSKKKIAKIAEIGFQLLNNELLLSNNELSNNEYSTTTDDNELSNNEYSTTTDDNEFFDIKQEVFDKLTPKTEIRSNKHAKVVWKQYRLLNPRKIEKRKRAQKFSKRQVRSNIL